MDSNFSRVDRMHGPIGDAKLERILEHLPAAAYLCDSQGLIVYFNRRAEELWGRAPALRAERDRYCGSFRLFLADGTPLRHDQCWMARAMLENRAIDGAEAVIERPDGELRTVLAYAQPLTDQSGSVLGGVNVLVDVTSQKQVENDLRIGDERYRSLIERMSVLAWEGDPATLCFTYVSDFAEALLGFPREAWYEPGFWVSRLHPEDRDTAVDYCTKTTAAGQDHRFDYRMIRADGSIVWVDDVVQVVLKAGKVVGLRGLMIDITQRKRLEEQLRHAQKMEAVGRLAGGVAHDFNNLLTVITGHSQLLLAKMAPADPHREPLQAIGDAADRAAVLTRELLTFSRRRTWQPVTLDLSEVVRETAPLVERLLGREVVLDVRCGFEPVRARVDRGQIGQVVMNLAVNARDAMPYGGRCVIAVDHCHWDETHADEFPSLRPGRYARLTVTDTGNGIAEEVKPHIFEPFFTTKEIDKGTGLGLAVVHGIVSQSGGWIGVRSGVGMGTTFTILLPWMAE